MDIDGEERKAKRRFSGEKTGARGLIKYDAIEQVLDYEQRLKEIERQLEEEKND